MNAKDIALSAYSRAVAAEEVRLAAIEDAKAEEKRKNEERHRGNFEAALLILNEWFPGVQWTYEIEGDWGHDMIVYDASESQWPPSFKLKVNRYLIDMNEPDAGYKMEFEVGDYVVDTMSGGYSYFSGTKVKSPADVGRYLKRKEDREANRRND